MKKLTRTEVDQSIATTLSKSYNKNTNSEDYDTNACTNIMLYTGKRNIQINFEMVIRVVRRTEEQMYNWQNMQEWGEGL